MKSVAANTVQHWRIRRAILAGMILWFLGCSPNTSNQRIHLVVSGDTSGWITPCGCAVNQSGGLERRATLVDSFGPKERVVYLDAGGSAAGNSEYQQLKLKSILIGDGLMGIEAHNIGAPETGLSPDVLIQVAKDSKIKLVSANLEPASGPAASIPSHQLIERKGIKILVTGVIDPRLLKNEQWKARDAAACLLPIIKQHKADVVLVLAYMDEPRLRALAESVPEVDFIVGGPTGQMLPPSSVGSVRIMSATNKGKFLACIELQREGIRWKEVKSGPKEVSSTLTQDKIQTKNMEQFLVSLGEKDFAASETGLAPHKALNRTSVDNYEIAGSASCMSCHQDDNQIWHVSKHAHAWQTLVEKRSQVDPSCQQCHTTGYGLSGGFSQVATSSLLVNVGCESCHGPSKAHVLSPKIKTTYLAKEQCIRCHDHENSPEFAYPSYWAKVAHGQKTEIPQPELPH